jgi:hypothetical protein
MQEPESNLDRLKDAGILDRDRQLTPEQYDAIDSLTPGEVDNIISANDKLAGQGVSEGENLLIMPGINPIGDLGE